MIPSAPYSNSWARAPDPRPPARRATRAEPAARLWRDLCSYADKDPLLVAVDDVHLADAPSFRLGRERGGGLDAPPRSLDEALEVVVRTHGDGMARSFAWTVALARVISSLPPTPLGSFGSYGITRQSG